jgi:hypothetical protein
VHHHGQLSSCGELVEGVFVTVIHKILCAMQNLQTQGHVSFIHSISDLF